MKYNLDGKVAVVSRATSELGSAIKKALEENGVLVVDAGEANCKESIKKLVDETISKNGKIDILVNVARGEASDAEAKKFWEYEDSIWENAVRDNIFGVYYLTKEVAKHMVEKHSGSIVNVSSALAVVPAPEQFAFCGTDAGINHFSRAMAIEIGKEGVRVNSVMPGIKDKGINNNIVDDEFSQPTGLLSHIPARRDGSAFEKAASLVCFLSSDDASYINGAQITADGGWSSGYSRDF